MSNETKVTTGIVRLSYVHLFQPYAGTSGGEPKYSATVLLPKSDIETKRRLDAAIEAAKASGVTGKWNGQNPPYVPTPIHDGDEARPSDGMPFGPECRGHWVFTASSKDAPQVVDRQVQPIINASEIYSGIYAHVSVNFFPYNANGKKGVGCGLGNVQKVADGESLGGARSTAAEDFTSIGEGAPSQAQAYPQQQPQVQAYAQQAYPQQAYPPPQAPAYAPPVQQPQYTQQQYQQPPQPPAYATPQQPAYYPPQSPVGQAPAVDPITGLPVPQPALGGVMGIG